MNPLTQSATLLSSLRNQGTRALFNRDASSFLQILANTNKRRVRPKTSLRCKVSVTINYFETILQQFEFIHKAGTEDEMHTLKACNSKTTKVRSTGSGVLQSLRTGTLLRLGLLGSDFYIRPLNYPCIQAMRLEEALHRFYFKNRVIGKLLSSTSPSAVSGRRLIKYGIPTKS